MARRTLAQLKSDISSFEKKQKEEEERKKLEMRLKDLKNPPKPSRFDRLRPSPQLRKRISESLSRAGRSVI